jgi:hypothetical protein
MAAVPRLSVYYNGEQVTAADMGIKKKKKKKKTIINPNGQRTR